MTAIAYRDGILAADRQVSWDGIRGVAVKMQTIRVPSIARHVVVAMSGNVRASGDIIENLKINGRGTGTAFDGCTVSSRYGIAVDSDGRIYPVYGDGKLGSVDINEYVAEGSAFQFLMGAMAQGASAPEAVQLACKHLDYCGMGIDAVNVQEELKKYESINDEEPVPW